MILDLQHIPQANNRGGSQASGIQRRFGGFTTQTGKQCARFYGRPAVSGEHHWGGLDRRADALHTIASIPPPPASAIALATNRSAASPPRARAAWAGQASALSLADSPSQQRPAGDRAWLGDA